MSAGFAFRFLQDFSTTAIGAALANQPAKVIAITLSQMNASRVPSTYSGWPPIVRRKVRQSLESLRPPSAETLRHVSAGVYLRLQQLSRVGGSQKVQEILQHCDVEFEACVLQRIQKIDLAAAERISACRFGFQDLASTSDRAMRRLLCNIDHRIWAMALKQSSEDLKQHVRRHLTSHAVRRLGNEINYLGTVTCQEVDAAQAHVVDVARYLLCR